MPLTRAKKTEKIGFLAADFENSTSAIVGTFAGLTASKDFELRKAVRAAGGSYHVVKNKLAAKAGEGTKIEAALKGLKGVSSVAYTSGDPVCAGQGPLHLGQGERRVYLQARHRRWQGHHRAGDWRARQYAPARKSSSRSFFLIQSPAQRLATVINATGRDLRLLSAREWKRASSLAPLLQLQRQPLRPLRRPLPRLLLKQLQKLPRKKASWSPRRMSSRHPAADEAQPENGTASQAGEAATTDPVEG